jgi:tRNA-dihydrouridine synthase
VTSSLIGWCLVGAFLQVPVFVKVRLLDTIEDSIELVEGLAGAGAALVAIHARYVVKEMFRECVRYWRSYVSRERILDPCTLFGVCIIIRLL